jgi:hypothetical protein
MTSELLCIQAQREKDSQSWDALRGADRRYKSRDGITSPVFLHVLRTWVFYSLHCRPPRIRTARFACHSIQVSVAQSGLVRNAAHPSFEPFSLIHAPSDPFAFACSSSRGGTWWR